MSFSPDIASYLARIGSPKLSGPNLESLHRIAAAHVQAIPFENLDVVGGIPISIDPAQIQEKLIHRRRGGYCFEQNTFLLHVLTTLGYDVAPMSARVRIDRARDFTPPRTHLCLRVELDGRSWIVDVGVGGLSPTSALALELEVEQPTPHEPRRFLAEGRWSSLDLRSPQARLFHQAYFGGTWHDVYEFTLEPMPLIDREVANWYTSTHPASHFRSTMMVARATAQGRITLRGTTLTTRLLSGTSESRTLRSRDEVLEVLSRDFGLSSSELTLPPDLGRGD